ncbi:hypothetical protein AAHH72_01590 [Bacillus cereus]
MKQKEKVSSDILSAISILYSKYEGRRELYFQDRLDKAIEYLLNSSDRKGQPGKLAFNAWSNAGKFLAVRGKYHDTNFDDFQNVKAKNENILWQEVIDWLEHSSIQEHYKNILFYWLKEKVPMTLLAFIVSQ